MNDPTKTKTPDRAQKTRSNVILKYLEYVEEMARPKRQLQIYHEATG
jgi:hypothetical protein